MKKIFTSFFTTILLLTLIVIPKSPIRNKSHGTALPPQMCIVIDDFGSYDETGVKTLLSTDLPITCAVLPNVDNTEKHLKEISESQNKEIILHMPMQSHVKLNESWYGPTYIKTGESKQSIDNKFKVCLESFPEIKGFNIHIGSGVSRNKETMTHIYNYAKEHNLYFLDSRTIETHAVEDAAKETNSIYLGRDEFLEADKNKNYTNVKFRLMETAKKAITNGTAIAIGHVGAEGGEQTAKAIIDTIPEIQKMGVEIVTLSTINDRLSTK